MTVHLYHLYHLLNNNVSSVVYNNNYMMRVMCGRTVGYGILQSKAASRRQVHITSGRSTSCSHRTHSKERVNLGVNPNFKFKGGGINLHKEVDGGKGEWKRTERERRVCGEDRQIERRYVMRTDREGYVVRTDRGGMWRGQKERRYVVRTERNEVCRENTEIEEVCGENKR